jgi:hypothetical protein
MGVQEPNASFPTWWFDYDNDGWLDLFVSGYGANFLELRVGDVAADYLGLPFEMDTPRLYHNRGMSDAGPLGFEDRTAQAGLDRALVSMGGNFGDLDNDGFLDFYLGTGAPDFRALMPNRMFLNQNGQEFRDVTTAGGFGHLQKGHGISFGDLDNDGDQDVLTVLGGAYSGDVFQNALFLNPGTDSSWLTLRLEGTRSNRSAIGARIRVLVATEQGPRQIFATVGSGGSFGASSLQQEIGLGDILSIDRLDIRWPGGVEQTFLNLEPNRFLHIIEGAEKPVELYLSAVPLPNGQETMVH